MSEVNKVQAAIDAAHAALNPQIDAAFKARKLNVVRTLDLASKALERATGHLKTAAEQDAKGAENAAQPGNTAGETAQTAAGGKKK